MRHLWFVVGALLLSGCSEFSCEGTGFEVSNAPFPDEKVVDQAVELTVTREGGDFIEQSGLDLVSNLLGQGDGAGWVDVSDIINDVLETNPISVLNVSVREVVAAIKLPNPEGLQVTFLEDPTRVRIEVDELWVRFESTVVDGTTRSACRIRGDVDGGTTDVRMFTLTDIDIDIELGTTPDGGFDVTTNVSSLTIQDSGIDFVTDENDPWYYCNYPECSDGLPPQCGECAVVCGAGDFLDDIGNFFIEAFDQLIRVVAEVIVNAVLDRVEQISGRIHPALLLGSILDNLYDAEALELGLRPADGFRVTHDVGPEGGDLGVSLGVGLDVSTPHPCVAPLGDEPVFEAGPAAQSFIPDSGDRPHLGLSASQAFINQFLWSLYKSGALCLEVNAKTVSELTSGQINLTAGLLSLLLPGLEGLAPRDAPILIALKPRFSAPDFPLVRYGSGEDTGEVNEDGVPIKDSLIQVTLRETSLGLYARIDDQYVQLIEVTTDLSLGVTPSMLPDSRLSVGIDSVELANLRETYDELFQDAQVEELLGFVAELATSLLLSNDFSLPISVSDLAESLFGIPLGVALSDFNRTGPGDDWLSLAVTLEYGGGAPLSLVADTALAPDAAPAETLTSGEPLWLNLQGAPGALPPLEAQVQIDGLAWSSFRPAERLPVASHLLRLPGRHTVRVRARHEGLYRSLDPTPLELSVEVLPAPQAQDSPPPLELSEDTMCSAAPLRGEGSSAPTAMLLLGALLLIGRSRRVALLTAAAGVAVSLLGCDDEVAQQVRCESTRDCIAGQVCGCGGVCTFPLVCATSADCCGGRACVDGVCEATVECREDADCSRGEVCDGCQCVRTPCAGDAECEGSDVCVDGLCQAANHVPCDGSCDVGEVCVRERDVCVSSLNFCDSTACEPGELVVMTGSAGYIGESCSYDGIGCGCRAAPALPEARPGSYVSMDRAADGTYRVAAYEPHYGDLVVIEADAGLALGDVVFVDGVPDTRPNADPEGPRGGVGVPGPDIGRYASLAIAPDGTIGVASYDRDEQDLRVAVLTPGADAWTRFTLDEAADSGRYASIAALDDGRFVIAYQQRELNAAGAGPTHLRIALSKGAQPAGPGDFLLSTAETVTLEAEGAPCGGACVGGQVCVADSETCVSPNAPEQCASSCAEDAACVDGDCAAILVAPPRSDDDPVGTGLFPDVAVQSDGRRIAVPFYDASTGTLRAAVGDAIGPWDIVTLDEGENRAGFGPTNVGREAAGVVDAADILHVAYVDDVSGELKHLRYDIAAEEVAEVGVADAGRAQREGYKLGALDIVLRGAEERPVIAFQDTSSGALFYTQRRADGGWDRVQVDPVQVAGFSPSLYTEGGELIVAYGRLYAEDGELSFELGLRDLP